MIEYISSFILKRKKKKLLKDSFRLEIIVIAFCESGKVLSYIYEHIPKSIPSYHILAYF